MTGLGTAMRERMRRNVITVTTVMINLYRKLSSASNQVKSFQPRYICIASSNYWMYNYSENKYLLHNIKSGV